jgi:magnesium chelatase accessory protein
MDYAAMPSDWPNSAVSRQIAVPPHRWHVQFMGTGPQILLIHGAGGATHSWRALMPILAQTHTVIVPDLPGQGFTTLGRRNRCGLDPMAEDLAALCAAQGWRPRAIIGHSAGAAIALRLSELLPETPKAVVGINAALGPFEGVAGWLFPLFAKLLALNPFVPRLFARFSGGPDRTRTLLASTGSALDDTGVRLYARLTSDPAHVDATLAMMSQWNLAGLLSRLPGIAVPTLFITSVRDHAVPPATSDRAAARMPDAQVLSIPDYGHLVHEENADVVAEAILPFLARHGVP